MFEIVIDKKMFEIIIKYIKQYKNKYSSFQIIKHLFNHNKYVIQAVDY